MVEAGTIRALSKVMEVGAVESVLGLVAAALRCLTQVASPKEASLKDGVGAAGGGEGGGGGGGHDGGGESTALALILPFTLIRNAEDRLRQVHSNWGAKCH